MKINAYLLAADPAWLEESVLSYYDRIGKLVVSFDENDRSWTGKSIAAAACVARLKAIDRDGKMQFLPGDFARPNEHPLQNETHQRQLALNEASRDADWVLQFDSDEIVPDDTFFRCLEEADAQGFEAMNYPSRWLYKNLKNGFYLEQCSRFWRVVSNYPGALAVRSGTVLRLARQCDARAFHVDVRAKSTDAARAKDTKVHRVIAPESAILHFSMVRDEADLIRKTQTWGHARDRDWSPEIRNWMWSGKHPLLATLMTPLIRNSSTRRRLRLSRIAPPQLSEPEA